MQRRAAPAITSISSVRAASRTERLHHHLGFGFWFLFFFFPFQKKPPGAFYTLRGAGGSSCIFQPALIPGNPLGFIFVAERLPLLRRGKAEAAWPHAGALPKSSSSQRLGATMPHGSG